MGDAAIHDDNVLDAVLQSLDAAVHLGDHAAGDDAGIVQALGLRHGQVGDQGGGIVLIHEDARNVGHHDQTLSAQRARDVGSSGVAVDVVDVVSTIAGDKEGNVYNINGDTAAAHIAGALGAERLIMMTDIAGVLMDKDDPSTLIPHLTVSEAKGLYDSGVIAGGMIPKVDCCIEALEHGVKHVVIMDGRIPHSILMELLTDEGAGTMVTKG